MIPAVVGLSAVQEFVTRGRGTPVPFDPPQRLVTTGVYRYVRNPMQLSAFLVIAIFAAALTNVLLLFAAVVAHAYSVGLAGWDEERDLVSRFGERWRDYRTHVRPWLPRGRPWIAPEAPIARLYVGQTCPMCSEVGAWLTRRHPVGMEILPAESHPDPLTRITYECTDGYRASGVAAFARALEHLHIGWALAGAALRLPILVNVFQLFVDASGGEPRRLAATGLPPRVDDRGARC
jgi:hypothetical protein